MKLFGALLCVASLIALFIGLSLDTSVGTGLGSRVHNLGLMNEKQNLIIFGGAILIAGALLLALSGSNQGPVAQEEAGYRKCPSCAEFVRSEAKVCRYCQRDLPSLSELTSQDDAERERLANAQGLEGEATDQAESLLPKGICPNCAKTIPLASVECKHCTAIFVGPHSTWRPLPIGKG